MYEESKFAVGGELSEAHEQGWRDLLSPGAFWSGDNRAAMIEETRAAMSCELCSEQRHLISTSPTTPHSTSTDLPLSIVHVIHKIRNDPGRMTRRYLDECLNAGFSVEQYVELVSVVATSVIIDTFHKALLLSIPNIELVGVGDPVGQEPPNVVRDEAWVPVARADPELNELGIPKSANIVRSMGAVPSAVLLFFSVFRSHYMIADLPVDLQRPQAELVASRVSILNQCFY